MPTNARAALLRRILFGSQLAVIVAGSCWCLLCVGTLNHGWAISIIGAMVLSPFVAAASVGFVAYAAKWSKAFQSSLLLATVVVAALSSAVYDDVVSASHRSSTEALIYIFCPLWGFIIGGGLFVGDVWPRLVGSASTGAMGS
jgi:hypothetical protein